MLGPSLHMRKKLEYPPPPPPLGYNLQDFLFLYTSPFLFAKSKHSLIFLIKICFSYVFYKRKACVYWVVCALFSCICLVRLMLRNCSENKYFS